MPGSRSPARSVELVLSCEHGGNCIPPRYRRLFRGRERLLATHRGYDRGALELGRMLARALDAPLVHSTVSRLLVELNRSHGHPQLFAPWIPHDARDELLRKFYYPYRRTVEQTLRERIARGARVVHLSCHSFTPRFKGEVRSTEVGLLFDPAREPEARFCATWQRRLRRQGLRARRNDPYRGTDDGLTTYLRERFPASRYLGIEIEVNQRFPRRNGARWRALQRTIAATLARNLESF